MLVLTGLLVGGALPATPWAAIGQEARYTTDAGREAIAAGAVGSLLLLRQWILSDPVVGPADFDRPWGGSGFDGVATDYASESWRAWTDGALVGLWATAFAAALLPSTAGDGERWGRVVALAETGLLTLGTTEVLKMAVGRHRPYTYNSAIPDERMEQLVGADSTDARASFPSGHSSMAFAAATFSASVLTTTHDWSRGVDAGVWAATMGIAASTAIGRVRAGKHFPTDVIIGAALGTAFGLLTPSCHEVGDGFCALDGLESASPALEVAIVSVPFG